MESPKGVPVKAGRWPGLARRVEYPGIELSAQAVEIALEYAVCILKESGFQTRGFGISQS